MNKKTAVLDYLKKNKHITSMQAIKKFGATRLSAIIFVLREDYIILTEMKQDIDRFGNTCRWADYVYIGEKQ